MIRVKTKGDYLEIEDEGECWLRVTTHNDNSSLFIFNGIDWDIIGTYKVDELGKLTPMDLKYRCYQQWKTIYETFFMYKVD